MSFCFNPVKFNAQTLITKRLASCNKALIKDLILTLSCADAQIDEKLFKQINDLISDETNKMTTISTEMLNKIDRLLAQ